MACVHKFEKYLNLELLDFAPTTLIIGTFNPSLKEGNYAEWFYGRTDNNYFWEILPRVYGEKNLRKEKKSDWTSFCRLNKIALTDVISSIEDADEANEDHCRYLKEFKDSDIETKFKKHNLTQIISILEMHRSIKNVYFTTITKGMFWKTKWEPIEGYCRQNGLHSYQLMTPSKNARFKMSKDSGLSMADFIFNDWKEKWHALN